MTGEPEKPSDFKCHLSSSGNNTVTVEWTPGQNGGFVQTFMIQYRTEGENKWKEDFVVEQKNESISTKVVLENLTANSIYIVRMHSMNVEGNSSFTTEQIVRTLSKLVGLLDVWLL